MFLDLDFQGITCFFPTTQFQQGSPFYGFLPETWRVPGLKRSAKEALENPAPTTALDNFKLHLVTFGVKGSLRSSNPLSELAKDFESQNDSDDEVNLKLARLGDENDTVVLKKTLPYYDLSDKGVVNYFENRLVFV